MSDSDWDDVFGASQLLLLQRFLAILHINLLQFLRSKSRLPWIDLALGILDVLLEQIEGDVRFSALDGLSLMDVENVRGDLVVDFLVVDISDDEDAVETGKNGVLQLDLLLDLLEVVVSSEDGVGCR